MNAVADTKFTDYVIHDLALAGWTLSMTQDPRQSVEKTLKRHQQLQQQ
mgnify:CR=1 FL=1